MEQQKKAYVYALTAVLFWSTIASAFKISLGYLDVWSLLLYASIASTIALLGYLLIAKKLILLRALSGEDYLRSALLGLLNPFLYYIVLLNSYFILRDYVQQAMTINWVWPMTLVLLSIPILGQKIRLRSILAIAISFCGAFVIATRGDILGFNFSRPVGVLLALGSTIIWALFWIYNVRDKRDEAVRLFLNFAFGSVYVFFVFLVMMLFGKVRAPDFNGIIGAVYIGLFEMGITFLVWLKALKLARTTANVANLIYLVPFLSLVLLYFAGVEEIYPSTLVGIVLIVGGIILQKFWE